MSRVGYGTPSAAGFGLQVLLKMLLTRVLRRTRAGARGFTSAAIY